MVPTIARKAATALPLRSPSALKMVLMAGSNSSPAWYQTTIISVTITT